MACTNCNQTNPVSIYDIQYLYSNNQCNSCNDPECGSAYLNAKCAYYNGPNLTCSTINNADNLETVIQKIDEKLCVVSGDYSAYNFSCLTGITTEQQFVEGISDYVCILRNDLDGFINVTYNNDQSTTNNRFTSIEVPGTSSCSFVGLANGDTIQTVVQKLTNAVCSINTSMDVSSVDWDQCSVVSVPPTSVVEGFDLIIDQICQIKTDLASAGTTLPTFNNTTSCLDTPGTTDSLETTVNKIKDRLCLTPIFDINALSWTCVTKPSNTSTNLQAAVQSILTTLADIKQNLPTFDSGDFSVTSTNSGDACAGKTVSLAASPNYDRYVAIDVSDTTPGTLSQKITAGTNVTLDTTTTPGTMIINATGGTSADEKVKADVTDANPSGYLIDKVSGATVDGLSISTTVDNNQVKFTPGIDWSIFIPALIDVIQNDADLKAQFCAMIASCPSPCDAPTNVQAVAV